MPEIPVRRREGGGMPSWVWILIVVAILIVGYLLLNALT